MVLIQGCASFEMLCDGDGFMGVEMGGDKMMVPSWLRSSLPILNRITRPFSDFYPQSQCRTQQYRWWVSHELTTLKTLALVLKSSMSITRPDPKVDEGLHVSSSGVHHGSTIKVIVVSIHHSSIHHVQETNKAVQAGLPWTGTMSHEKSPRRTRLQKLLPPRRAPLPIDQSLP